MKISRILRSKKYGSIKKIILLTLLMIAIVSVFLHVIWSYHNFESGLGTRLAQMAISYHIGLLIGMVVVGVGLGRWVDLKIRQKKSIFRSPVKGSWTEAFMNLWGYELDVDEVKVAQSSHLPALDPPIIEPFDLFNMPARRGRKPTFPLERWIPIALKWENRDPIRDAFTLGELITEHLGTNSDGSPIVSEQTYYSVWRQRAIDEIRQRAKSKRSANMRDQEKETT